VPLTHDLSAKPGTSRRNLTGTWRVQVPKFLHEKCTGCEMCELSCPEGSVFGSMKEKHFDVDLDYCKGCGVCAAACPVGDIIMALEEK